MPRLDEVFKKSGIPTHTFVEPGEYRRVVVAMQTPGRGVIVEGPSGIGKTSCVRKVLEGLSMVDSCLFLSARKPDDQHLISELSNIGRIGTVVIDDFHRLPDAAKQKLTDFAKVLADEEDQSSKLILIGINRAGQSLVDYAPDLLHRIETIRIGRTNEERIHELITLGERALNCTVSVAQEIVAESEGSFAMAQVLCHEACIHDGISETQQTPILIQTSLPSVREAVIRELSPRFYPVAKMFATGNKLRREGRAPYLHLLKWLSQTNDGSLDTKEILASNPDLKGSILQVIDKNYLSNLIKNNGSINELIHFDSRSELLTSEDPKFLYFIRHLIWSAFSRQVGYHSIEFSSKYDLALSFAGEDRHFAESLSVAFQEREMSVFYDKNEQHRILGNDVEAYLAPVYRSESRYVVVLLSKMYPKKIWTKFESDQFKERFGENSVIPIWFNDTPPGLFDQSRTVGGLVFDSSQAMEPQVREITAIISKKLAEQRREEAASSIEPDNPSKDIFPELVASEIQLTGLK